MSINEFVGNAMGKLDVTKNTKKIKTKKKICINCNKKCSHAVKNS